MQANGHDNPERLDRIEANLDRLVDAMLGLAEHGRQTDAHLETLAGRADQLAGRVDQLAAAQIRNEERFERIGQRFDQIGERVDGLVGAIGELIRRMPEPRA